MDIKYNVSLTNVIADYRNSEDFKVFKAQLYEITDMSSATKYHDSVEECASYSGDEAIDFEGFVRELEGEKFEEVYALAIARFKELSIRDQITALHNFIMENDDNLKYDTEDLEDAIGTYVIHVLVDEICFEQYFPTAVERFKQGYKDGFEGYFKIKPEEYGGIMMVAY